VKRMLKMQRAATLVSVMVRDYLDSLEITDQELKAEYDAQIAGVDKEEYMASHILLENEADAQKIITEVKADGSNFADLAKKHSTGPSGKDGGELGWFSARSMVPEFADAVKGMKKGEVSKTPVQSEFGWHVIYLQDVRDIPLPSFEDSKERLKLIVAQKKLQEYIAELREKANIEIKGMEAPAASETSSTSNQ
jgi:peptidyl-prolyl cis-trans isomerase C